MDMQLLFDLRTDIPLNQDMLPFKLKYPELMMGEPVKCTLRRASQKLLGNGNSFFEFLNHPAPSLNLDTSSLDMILLQWHNVSVSRMVVALNEPILNWLKTTVARNATRGLAYRICGRNRQAENPIQYLIGLGFEGPRPYSASEVDLS
jgi:hypothetical protein